MGEPHARRDAFAGNVAEHCKHSGTILGEGRKVSGEVARREDFPGKLHIATLQYPGATELTLNLHRVKKLCMQIKSLSQERIDPIFGAAQSMAEPRRRARGSTSLRK